MQRLEYGHAISIAYQVEGRDQRGRAATHQRDFQSIWHGDLRQKAFPGGAVIIRQEALQRTDSDRLQFIAQQTRLLAK